MAIGSSKPRYRRMAGSWGAFGNKANATQTTAFAGTNNDIKITAKDRGTGGNSVRVAFVVAGASTPLSVSVSGNDITVNVATNGSSAATSTASQVVAALNAHAGASALIIAALAAGNDGTGVVAAQTITALSGGSNWTIGLGR